MIVRDFHFKFKDADSASLALCGMGFYRDDNGEFTHSNRAVSIDEIGVIHQLTGGTVVVDGEEVAVTAPIDGYHINIRALDEGLSRMLEGCNNQEFPATPVRCWA